MIKRTLEFLALLALLLLALPAVVQAQFTFTTNNGAITINYYTGSGGDVVIPSATNGWPVTSISSYVFGQANGTPTNVMVPSSITNIGNSAFAQQGNLKTITVNGLNPVYSTVDGVLFNKNQTVIIQCPGGKVGGYTMSNSVATIGSYAFAGCVWLTNVVISTNVTSIGNGAFTSCRQITSLTIPSSVGSVGNDAFSQCANLRVINVDALNSVFSSVDGVWFNRNQTVLLQYPAGKTGSYTIPYSVTNLADKAFSGCTGLSSVNIPTSISIIGNNVFANCANLTGVTIPASIASIGNNAFAMCNSLTNVLIPDSVTSIGNSAFDWCKQLASVTIGSSVTNIADWAFGSCDNLTSVYFKGNAPNLGVNVFLGSDNATVYYLPSTVGWMSFSNTNRILTKLWLLQMEAGDTSFGVWTNKFGFNINWASGKTVVVEASTDLSNPSWQPVQTNTLTTGSTYFSDPQWTNYPGRFYRLRSP